jgi:hypothetical protein
VGYPVTNPMTGGTSSPLRIAAFPLSETPLGRKDRGIYD